MTKIAITTDDGETVSSHFGQAGYFKVVLVGEQGKLSSEIRNKPSHQHNQAHHHEDSAAMHPGQAMLELISDCQVLITGGMGEPAYYRALAKNLRVILTGEKQIDQALEKFQNGTLISDERRIHKH